MRAVVRRGTNDVAIEDVEPTPLGPEDVLVRTGASGVCHSDLYFLGSEAQLPPVVLGHEGAGVVEEVGSAVRSLTPGDRVIASWVQPCGHCAWCLDGQTYLCAEWDQLSAVPRFTRSDGSGALTMGGLGTFSEIVIAKARALVKVETDLPDEQLALIGCGVTTGVCAAINAAAVRPGSTVAVFGCGGVGQSVVQGARVAGALRIFAVDPVALKRDSALKLGATDVVDPSSGGAVEQILEETGGRGVDYAFEVAGREDTLAQAYAAARRGGTLVLLGSLPEGVSSSWPMHEQVTLSKTVIGALYGHAEVQRDFPMVVKLAERGLLDIDAMVTRRVGLDEVPEALEAMQRGEVLRSVVTF